MERARDLFEQALDHCPAKFTKRWFLSCSYRVHIPFHSCPIPIPALYLLYAKLEEEHGMARHAMAVYDRATKAVLPEEQFDVRGQC